jgi:hypothetical protein
MSGSYPKDSRTGGLKGRMLTRVHSRLRGSPVAESETPATPQGRETSTRSGGRRRHGDVFLQAGTGKVLALPAPAIQPDHAGGGCVAHAVQVAGQAAGVAVAGFTAGRPLK